MKPHFIIKFLPGAVQADVPSWTEIIEQNIPAIAAINHPVDDVLKSHQMPVWITREYSPQKKLFTEAEIRAGLNRVYRFILQQNQQIPDSVINEIKLLPGIEYVRIGRIGSARIPDPQLAQATVYDSEVSRNQIFLKQAQFFSEGHPAIKIAVLDTGINLAHPELKEALTEGYDFVDIINGSDQFIGDYLGYDTDPEDEVGHGTHVAGIIAGKGINMPKGVVPKCKIMPLRVLGAMRSGDKKVGAGLVDNINTAIKWAVDNGADVINMSLGVKHEHGGLPHEEVIKYALEKGVTIVAASGNDGKNDKYYPGALPGVVAVGAVGDNDEIAAFSNYGVHVSLVAPGTNILSSFESATYAMCSGTSQAAPFVSGAVALLKSYARQNGKALKDNHVKYLLKHTSDKPGTQFKDNKWGYGRINLLDAVKLLQHMQEELN